jgi:poly(A) polymerase/tRNA nucleotidyltransferase (CCA-adding enzyme)
MIVNVGKENIWDLMDLRICDRVGTGRPKEEPYRLRKYMSMIEEALRDPISVSLLKIDGQKIMEVCNIKPSQRVGNILYALFNEVMKDPSKNTELTLKDMAINLNKMEDSDLFLLGEEGRNIKENIETKDIEEIRHKYHVK